MRVRHFRQRSFAGATMAVNEQEADRMFAHLKQESINVFYVKTPIEFGMTGES